MTRPTCADEDDHASGGPTAEQRLAHARRVLSGTDAAGQFIYDGIDAPGVLSLAHGNGTRRPHPAALAAEDVHTGSRPVAGGRRTR